MRNRNWLTKVLAEDFTFFLQSDVLLLQIVDVGSEGLYFGFCLVKEGLFAFPFELEEFGALRKGGIVRLERVVSYPSICADNLGDWLALDPG